MGRVARSREAEVAQADLARAAVDENVVALQIAMDNGRNVGMKVVQRSQNLTTPKENGTEAHKRATQRVSTHIARPFRRIAPIVTVGLLGDHFLMTLSLIDLTRLVYCLSVPDVTISVVKQI